MRKLAFLLVLLGLLAPQSVKSGEQPALDVFVQESRVRVKAFAGNLKGELQAAIKDGGPLHAIPVCNVEAPRIALDLSQPAQWTVGRTSHKLRNPDNAPDEWEAVVLDEFQRRAAAGESLKTMEHAEAVEDDGGRTYRYMKAIPVGEVCLTCHGSDIDPELKARIESFYPEDRATGFSSGELRGAFTVSRTDVD